MKLCQFCGTVVDPENGKCQKCGATSFITKCDNCGTVIEKGAFCPTCGTRIGQKAKTCSNCGTVYYTNACPNCGYIGGTTPYSPTSAGTTPAPSAPVEKVTYEVRYVEKKPRKTWLWVLGWLFIFPIPLTILICRNKQLSSGLKFFICLVVWGLYFGIVSSFDSSSAHAAQIYSQQQSIHTAASIEMASVDSMLFIP